MSLSTVSAPLLSGVGAVLAAAPALDGDGTPLSMLGVAIVLLVQLHRQHGESAGILREIRDDTRATRAHLTSPLSPSGRG